MKIIKHLLFCLMFFGFTFSYSYAQKIEIIKKGVNSTPKYIKFDASQKSDTQDSKTILRKFLPVKENDDFILLKSETDKLGFTHEKFQQYHNGIKVEYAFYTLHIKAGKPQSMNGDFITFSKTKSGTITISEEEALQKALDYIGAEKYMWEDEQNEIFAREFEPNGTFYPHAELVYVKDYYNEDLSKKFQTVLAYKFNIYAQEPLSRNYVYVNAQTGEIVFKNAIIKLYGKKNKNHKQISEIKKSDNPKSTNSDFAATRYSGYQSIETNYSGGLYYLQDYTRGSGIFTYDMKTTTNYYSWDNIIDDDNKWTYAEYHNEKKEDAAFDAHWGAEMVYDYWLNIHGRNSYDNSGSPLTSFVHYGVDYDNAFWNGSYMTYGDGSGYGGFDALTALDICAHEIGHAVCDYTANLIYSYESGALNEGFSDIWGTCIEFYAAPDKNTWAIGEDIDMRPRSPYLRSMSNPNACEQPDTYKGDYWYTGSEDYGGVHCNNSVLTHWFYLLTEGGSGINDNGDAYNVTGIGIDKAEQIAYKTESVYLNPDDEYADARDASIQAAEDLYGIGSTEVQQVENAWDAVGVYDGTSAYCSSQSIWGLLFLEQVDIGNFTNPSDSRKYTDFTNLTVELEKDNTHNVTLTQGQYGGLYYGLYWCIWIDFNGDNDFDDAGELVFDEETPNQTASVSGTISIPDMSEITTRMRIANSYRFNPGTKPLPCGNIVYGEIEDYTLHITESGTSGHDLVTPSVPQNLQSINTGENKINISWDASTDNVGVTGYNVFKNGTLYSQVTGTTALVMGLTSGTNFNFYVQAFDGAGNTSGNSNTIYVTTETNIDTEPPTQPAGLTASGVGTTQVSLSWTGSTDNVKVNGYKVYKNSIHFSTVNATNALITGLDPNTNYSFYVIAFDAAGNNSVKSNTVNVTTKKENPNEDTQNPTTPTGLTASNTGKTSTQLSWTVSTDNVAVSGYNIYKNGSLHTSVTGTSAYIQSLTPGENYNFYVNAFDPSNNQSGNSNTIGVTTDSDRDNQAPTAPQDLVYSDLGETFVNLHWTAATDNIGVTAYDIYQNGAYAKTVTGTSAIITNLSPHKYYTFYVIAKDRENNQSPNSNEIGVTTNYKPCYDGTVTLILTFDNNPGETSWEILNENSIVVESGNGYTTPNTTITEHFSPPPGLYTFKIYDANGLCCDNGNGSYQLLDGNGNLIYSGRKFTTGETITINVCDTGCDGMDIPTGYCSTQGNSQTDEWIDYVGLEQIDNITDGSGGGYKDYTSLDPAELSRNNTYTIYFSIGYSGFWYSEYWSIWIDYNQDGDFEDTDELIVQGGPHAHPNMIQANFTVPSHAKDCYTVMRVSMKYASVSTPCETFTWGEVEDYKIKILPATKSGVANNGNRFTNTIDISETSPEQFVLFPNPAKDIITITNIGNADFSAVIHNSSGILVKIVNIYGEKSNINIGDLPSGIYNIKLDVGQKTISRRFVKQ